MSKLDAVDGLDLGDRPLQDPALDREMLDQIADLDERRLVRRRAARGRRRVDVGDAPTALGRRGIGRFAGRQRRLDQSGVRRTSW